MNILVHTANSITDRERQLLDAETAIGHALRNFADQITRVEVHLGDTNGGKGGENDKRCSIEIRIEHHQPIAASHQAGTLHHAVEGAAKKARAAMESLVGRLGHRPHGLGGIGDAVPG
jgi:hypothetical protein